MDPMLNFFSPKQLESMRHSDAFINIWEGSIRSGKTHASLWRLVDFATHAPEGEFVIITRTYDSFKRNILPALQTILGRFVKYSYGKRELYIRNRLCHIVSADDSSAEAKIRGATFAGAYVDEVTIIPENVFVMLIGRLSIKGAKLFCTTNPDSPNHWFRKFMTNNQDVKSWQFIMEDNPSLDAGVKETLKRLYKGLWYKRFILGQWVQAEGAVYDFFEENWHVIDHAPSPNAAFYVGVDYGTTNPCAFVMVGFNKNKSPNMWVEKEYYFDSREMQRQKTDAEYAHDLLKFTEGKNVKGIYIDPSAASFKVEVARTIPFLDVYDAENEVIDGIRLVSKFIQEGRLKICRACPKLIQEFHGYVWDPKSTKLGIDKPLKDHDHALDALRYVVFSRFYSDDGGMSAQELDLLYQQTVSGQPNLPDVFQTPQHMTPFSGTLFR